MPSACNATKTDGVSAALIFLASNPWKTHATALERAGVENAILCPIPQCTILGILSDRAKDRGSSAAPNEAILETGCQFPQCFFFKLKKNSRRNNQ